MTWFEIVHLHACIMLTKTRLYYKDFHNLSINNNVGRDNDISTDFMSIVNKETQDINEYLSSVCKNSQHN